MKLFNKRTATGRMSKEEHFAEQAYPLMDRIYTMALQLTHNKFDAEDLVQSTYMRAWQYYRSFQQGSNFKAWLMKILTNNYVNEYRRTKRLPPYENFDDVSFFISSPENEAYKHDLNSIPEHEQIFDDKISTAINRLPEHYRIVILLADVNEMRYQEIAEVLRCPIGTVMSRLNRGRKMLAGMLKKHAKCYGLELTSA